MIPAAFAYVRAASPEAAFAALSDPDARAIAGGHSLLPLMKLRFAIPSVLVDIRDIGWRGVHDYESEIAFGALTTYDELLATTRVPGLTALYECAACVGDLQVRNAGTIGGGIAHADPAADLAAGAIALEARLCLESLDGTRHVPAEDFFLGPFSTELRRGELLSAIVIPRPAPWAGSAYESVEDPASGYPLAGAAVAMQVDQDRIAACSIGITGASTRPFRARALEELFVQLGRWPTTAELQEALATVPILGEGEGDVEYRRHLMGIVVYRAATEASRRAAERTWF